MTTTLPIAIVIPHTGLQVPPELVGRVALTERQIFNEADVYTDLIYDFRERVAHWHAFPYARAILDVNRPDTPLPGIREGDGYVKHRTSYGEAVYKEGQVPDAALEQHLIETYWRPWHDTMETIARDDRVKLVLDCHSMAAFNPWAGDTSEPIRPRITASNLGDEQGEPIAGEMAITAPAALTRRVAQLFGDALADVPDLAPTAKPYDINQPYRGGPNIWLHGGKAQPWLMIELSRATYIGQQAGDSPVTPPDMERITLIREKLWRAIVQIVAQL